MRTRSIILAAQERKHSNIFTFRARKCSFFFFLLTVIAVVIHQDYLLEQVGRGVIDSGVDRAQDHRQGLVDKDEDEGDLLEVPGEADLSASAGGTTRQDDTVS